jgi:hypothetical protein
VIPTREDIIRLLTKEPQASVPALCEFFVCTASEALRALKASSDFEPCAPRAEDGHGFAWRLSSLSVDPRVRAAAMIHQRDIEQPPQRRTGNYTSVRPAGSAASVLLDWLRQNPGEWTLAQIADARGVGIVTIRQQVEVHRTSLVTRLQATGKHGGKHLLVSLKPHLAA